MAAWCNPAKADAPARRRPPAEVEATYYSVAPLRWREEEGNGAALRIEAADQPIPQSIPQHFQTGPAPANATSPIDIARSGYAPNAPMLADAANAHIHRL